MTEAKNVYVSYIFHFRSHVIAKRSNGGEEIAGRCQNNSFCQTNMSPGFCLVKHFVFLKDVCYQYLNFVLQ